MSRREYDKTRFNRMDDLQRECRRFYSRLAWKEVRAKCLRHNPLCVKCAARKTIMVATEVDHEPPLIEQLREGRSGLDMDFLQSLCKSCHSSKTAREVNSRAAM